MSAPTHPTFYVCGFQSRTLSRQPCVAGALQVNVERQAEEAQVEKQKLDALKEALR